MNFMRSRIFLLLVFLVDVVTNSALALPYTYDSSSVRDGSIQEKNFIQKCAVDYMLHFQNALPQYLKSLGISDTRFSSTPSVTKSCRKKKCVLGCVVDLVSETSEFDFLDVQSQIYKGPDALLECRMEIENMKRIEAIFWTKIVWPKSDRCFVDALRIKF